MPYPVGEIQWICFPELHRHTVLLPESFRERLLLRHCRKDSFSRAGHLFVQNTSESSGVKLCKKNHLKKLCMKHRRPGNGYLSPMAFSQPSRFCNNCASLRTNPITKRLAFGPSSILPYSTSDSFSEKLPASASITV